MKYWKKLIIPACLLAVLVIGLVLVSTLGKGGTTPTTTRTASSVEFLYYAEETDVKSIELENEAGSMILDRTEATATDGTVSQVWTMRTPVNPAYSAESLTNLATTMRTISSVRLIAENVTDFGLYGLDKPAATMTATGTDGGTAVVYLGNSAGSGSNYYAMAKGSGKVFTVSTSVGDLMLSAAKDMLDTKLCSVEYNNVKSFRIRRAADDANIVAVSSPFYDDDGKLAELQWRFTDPIRWMGDTMSVEPVVDEIITATAEEFLTMDVKPSDLAQYGLDNPSYVFEITDENQTYTITLGKSAGSGLFYGMSSRIPNAVFTTTTANFTLVDGSFTEWLNGFVYLADITKVTHVDLAFDDVKLDIEIDGKSEPNVFKINGKDANIVNSSDKSYFKSFYQSIIGGTLAGIDPDANPSLSKAIMTVDYTFREDAPASVAFVPRDPYSLYAFLNGEYTGGYVDIKVLDDKDYGVGNILPTGLRPADAGLVNAMQKAVDGVYN